VHERRLEGPNLSDLTPTSLQAMIVPRAVSGQLSGNNIAEKLAQMMKVSFPHRAAEQASITKFNWVEVARQRYQHKGEGAAP
jgi:hypothetical protein